MSTEALVAAGKAFFGGFLDGFSMAGFWKPRLTIPGAATELFRPEPEEAVAKEETGLEHLTAIFEEGHIKIMKRTQETQATLLEQLQQGIAETRAAIVQMTAEREREIEELSLLYSIAIKQGMKLGLDEEQMNKMHASILERLRHPEHPLGRQTRQSESEHPTY